MGRVKRPTDQDKKRLYAIYAVVGLLSVLIISLLILMMLLSAKSNEGRTNGKNLSTTSSTTSTTVPVIYSRLDGRPIDSDSLNRQVLAVVIENHSRSRPQSALNEAEIVFEAVAEGGITRFLAIFQRTSPPEIGPIRSAREYFVDLAKGYDAIFLHAGGSPTGFEMITSLNVDDIDALEYEDEHFERARGRKAPHNLYGSDKDIRALSTNLGHASERTVNGFKFQEPTPKASGASSIINIDFSTPNYKVKYEWNASTDLYERYNGERLFTSFPDEKTVTPRNIVVIFTQVTDLDEFGRKRILLEGGGKALLFNGGKMHVISWFHDSAFNEMRLKDGSGNDATLYPGQTWFEIVSSDNKVTYEENDIPVPIP